MIELDTSKLFHHQPSVKIILTRLKESGYRAVIVGGAVRDLLREQLFPQLSIDYSKLDVDIATDAPVQHSQRIFDDFRTVEVGAKFGVLVLIDSKDNEYELARFRTEEDYDGRKPQQVQPTTSLEEDVQRRDFTVNGLALEEGGQIIDYVGGIKDVKSNLINAIGGPYKRFQEDYLRILRAVRFSCQLGATIHPETYQAIKTVAESISSISAERITEEMFGILSSDRSCSGIEMMHDLELLTEILPELEKTIGTPQPEQYHPEGDVFTHSLEALEVADSFNYPPIVKLAVLVHDIGKTDARERHEGQHMGGHSKLGAEICRQIADRWKLSNSQTDQLTWLVTNHMKIGDFPRMNTAKQVRLIQHDKQENISFSHITDRYPSFCNLLRLLVADSEASVHGADGWLPPVKSFVHLLPHLRNLHQKGNAKQLLNGQDLLNMGLEEGPIIGKFLEEIYHQIYSGEISDREEALCKAEQLVQREKDKG